MRTWHTRHTLTYTHTHFNKTSCIFNSCFIFGRDCTIRCWLNFDLYSQSVTALRLCQLCCVVSVVSCSRTLEPVLSSQEKTAELSKVDRMLRPRHLLCLLSRLPWGLHFLQCPWLDWLSNVPRLDTWTQWTSKMNTKQSQKSAKDPPWPNSAGWHEQCRGPSDNPQNICKCHTDWHDTHSQTVTLLTITILTIQLLNYTILLLY